jgi:hypothetical protein
MRQRRIKLVVYLALLLVMLRIAISPPPTPHSVAGYIFRSNGVTQVPLGTKYTLNDTNSTFFISGQTNIPIPGMSGMYFETVDGSDQDTVILTSWNATHYGRKSYILFGDMENVNASLNTPRPPETKVVITTPVNNSVKSINTTINVTANITAIGGAGSTGCNATIQFSHSSVFSLSSGENSTHRLGNMPLGNSVLTTWHVVGIRGWSTNIKVTSKCSSDGENFEKLNSYATYNISVSDTELPSVSLESPKNKTWARLKPVVLTYNVSDFSGIRNCSLYFDGKLNKTNTSVKTSVSQNFTLNMLEGNHTWLVGCFDNSSHFNRANSSRWVVNVDTKAPNITDVAPDNNLVSANNTVVFKYNVSDANKVMNCSLIVNKLISQTNKSIVKGVLLSFTKTFKRGSYLWQINCTDAAGNTGASATRTLIVTDPDFMIQTNDISFSTNNPVEGQNITINISVHNIGDENGTNVMVKLYENSMSGPQISNVTLDIPAQSTVYVAAHWIGKIGKHRLYVEIDPPAAANGSIVELNETNNIANRSIYLAMWQVFYGTLLGQLRLDTVSNTTLKSWTNISNFFGNIYVTDSDSSISWATLHALGNNLSNKTEMDDFDELDVSLNATYLNDSINWTYTLGGAAKAKRSFRIFDTNITDVPFIYSTNSSNFVTGILWDYSDLPIKHYNGSQDIVFVGNVGKAIGAYGSYDYEMRIPANLRKYKKPNDKDTVTFYTEIV